MALDFLRSAAFYGPAFPEPFVRFELERELAGMKLLPRLAGDDGRRLQEVWESYRRSLRALVAQGGPVRVANHVLEPLVSRLGYTAIAAAEDIQTREGLEPGGHILTGADGARLRAWAAALGEDLDAPVRRGRAFRFSHAQIARRVLQAAGERLGILTNGVEFRIVISDPARTDSWIEIPIESAWKRSREAPESYVLLLALASPAGVRAIPDLIETARLRQTGVTRELRRQAREAVELFVQDLLDHPANRAVLAAQTDHEALARQLWHEGLLNVFRLLFILKLEATDDPARAFSFASTSLWRHSFSPSLALAPYVRAVLDQGQETGRLLEDGLRLLFRMFTTGLECTELRVKPLGGALFGEQATPLLAQLQWGERAVAHLLDRLLWTIRDRSSQARERVHYGPLSVGDLGRVYESLIELEPGLAAEPMCRLRRRKLEVVVPLAQGERYRTESGGAAPEPPPGRLVSPDPSSLGLPTPAALSAQPDSASRGSSADAEGGVVPGGPSDPSDPSDLTDSSDDSEDSEDDTPARGRKTPIDWIEEIPAGRFYLRVGLGRKASGSYYTPDSFVRFLVQETLGPQVEARSPKDDPRPAAILDIKVLDDAMGSGHFLFEACRYLGEALYEACRLCDELALEYEHQAVLEEKRTEAPPPNLRRRISDPPDLPLQGREAGGASTLQMTAQAMSAAPLPCAPMNEGTGESATPRQGSGDSVPAASSREASATVPGDGASAAAGDAASEASSGVSGGTSSPGRGLRGGAPALSADALRARAEELRARIQALPDPEDELLAYLPSRAPEDGETALSAAKARAICRRLVAVHCLYGVDLNPLAVELAKLSLWIETHAEGMPLTFLDHRLVAGNSLTGPFFEHLLTMPGTQTPLPANELYTTGLQERLSQLLQDALREVRELEASVGVNLGELQAKQHAKDRLDERLAPLRLLAAAWAGGVMLGTPACDDEAYAQLVKAVVEGGDRGDSTPAPSAGATRLPGPPSLAEASAPAVTPADAATVATGSTGEAHGRTDAPTHVPLAALLAANPRLQAMIDKGRNAVPFDLTFPEVFWRTGDPAARSGFDAVLGNPPWDAIQFKSKEFFATFDISILDAPTKREREAIERRLTAGPACGPLFERYKEEFEETKRSIDQLYAFQKVFIDGDLCGRQLDAFRVFMERNAQMLGHGGLTGAVVPSAFHANEGATGVRRLYLETMALRCCYSFENRRKLFDIDSRFKFALVVAAKPLTPRPSTPDTHSFPCAFYLHDDEWLFGGGNAARPTYSLAFVRRTGGEYLSLLEARTNTDVQVSETCYLAGETVGGYLARHAITPNTSELPMVGGAFFTPTHSVLQRQQDARDPAVAMELLGHGLVAMHEGKTFWQFEDRWEDRPRYLVSTANLQSRPRWLSLCRYFRLVYREVSCSTNERTGIFCVLAPPHVTCRNAASDISPDKHSAGASLLLAGVGNSFTQDFLLRFWAQTHVTLFMLSRIPLPTLGGRPAGFVVHSALRLTCNHAGYAPLWREQVGDAWREPGRAPFTWPVLEGDDARWAVRAAIDAVVADAYGLNREQYAHVLSTFSHKSYPKAPELCLAAFDELKAIGLEAFTQKHDPYWDIPLNEALPKPVIDLPMIAGPGASVEGKVEGGTQSVAGTKKTGDGRSSGAVASEGPDEYRLTADPLPAKRRRRR